MDISAETLAHPAVHRTRLGKIKLKPYLRIGPITDAYRKAEIATTAALMATMPLTNASAKGEGR